MKIEIDDKLQIEILSLRRKILADSPFAYMQHVSGDCVNVVRKLGKIISDEGPTVKEICLMCYKRDCDNCKYSNH